MNYKWTRKLMMHDWMKTVRSPIRYRVNQTVNLKLNYSSKLTRMSISLLTCLFLLIIFHYYQNSSSSSDSSARLTEIAYRIFSSSEQQSFEYNRTYPLSRPVVRNNERIFSLMAIADLDTNSKANKNDPKYVSYLLSGKLVVNLDTQPANKAYIHFDDPPIEIDTQYAYGDRGMELSELIVFNGKLYSCDDRTGIIYEITAGSKPMAIPWVILVDGDGRSTSKGFKCEWMTVKDEKLYVGGLGKEWTTSKGVLVNHNPQWVKVVGHLGDIAHLDWKDNYESLRAPGGFTYPGYMIFESCAWNADESKWYFLPRRASREKYDELEDEKRGANLMISSDNQFKNVEYKRIGQLVPVRGYSSFKFVPHTQNRLIIALKSEEDAGKTRTYVTLFDKEDGTILIKDQIISDNLKYEGIEFV